MLGIYVSDHPLRDIEETVRAAAQYSLGELDELADGTIAWFAGIVTSVDSRPTKRGAMMASAVLEDLDGSVEAVLFPQVYERARDIVQVDTVLRMRAKFEDGERGKKLMVMEVEPFDGAEFAQPPKRLVVRADGEALVNGRAEALKKILMHFPGRDFVELHVWDAGQEKTIVCRMPERVNAEANGLHAELMEMFGAEAVGDPV
jgi:DNA polymerase-3 subunit alpha